MATLKGQNFRIGTLSGGKYTVYGMATSCTVTLNSNTDDASTKDDVGMASKPTVNSQNWQVQVESLSVADTAALLTAMKSATPLTLMWAETATSDNQTAQNNGFSYTGTALLSDATFTFNDRENSSKSLQFTGSGALTPTPGGVTTTVVSAGAYTKGQYVRLFLGSDNTETPSKVIAFAKSLSLHVSLQLEASSTKDTVGNFEIQEVTGLSYDISTNALVRSGESISSSVLGQNLASIEDIFWHGNPVKWQIANVSGPNNRIKGSVIISGSVVISSISISAQNRTTAAYDTSLTGYGEYTVGA